MDASLSSEMETMVSDSITSELVEREEAKPWLDEQARQGSSTPGSRTDAGVLILQAAEPFDLLSAECQTNKKNAPRRNKE